jgi:hypothetical protein
MLGYTPAIVGIRSEAVRVIECAELLAADLFKNADQTRQRVTLGDVERYLAQLASHPPDCTCGRCPLVSRVTAQRVYAIAASGACDQGARAALIRSRAQTAPRSAMHAIDGVRGAVNFVRRRNRRRFRDRAISVCDRDLGPSHHAGQVVILIPRATAAVVLRRPVPRSRADRRSRRFARTIAIAD